MPSLLDECAVLKEMFDTGMAIRPSGDVVPMHSNLSVQTAEALYSVVLANRPSVIIEVGMAFGISSLAMLTALHRVGSAGQLISVDPHQSSQWGACGITVIERAGFKDKHRLIEEFDYAALPKLLGSGQRAQLAFIDAWHTFDYVLLDFWYLDKMLDVGGIVGFDDCTFPSVHKAIRFIQSHRKYEEIDVGLPVRTENYSGLRGRVKRLMSPKLLNWARHLTGRQTRFYTRQNRYFRKTQQWEPNWDFFADF